MPARQRNAARFVLATIMLAALAANACYFGAGGPASTPTATATPPATLAVSPTLPGRTAVLNDLVGNVQSRPAGGGKDVPATNGQTLDEGSQVRTGGGSKAKISLSDGTILRLRPDTLITLDRLIGDPSNPFTRLLLALGKVFVILKSGHLEVQSPAGVAAVTGSFLSVEYLAGTNTVVVTCLEGSCTLRNDQGGVALATGQAASLSGSAGASPVLRWMTLDEIQAWLDDNPEAQSVAPLALTALPTATGTETPTATATATATASPTSTKTPTATATRRPLPTATKTATLPPPPTATPTAIPTASPTVTPTRPPPTAPPTLTATSVVAQQPLVYAFQNACDPADPNGPGTYHVTIDGLSGTTKFDVAPQSQPVSGQLPPGQYTISWQPDKGQGQQMAWFSDTGPFNWTFCGKP
jgi:hypothetical protein